MFAVDVSTGGVSATVPMNQLRAASETGYAPRFAVVIAGSVPPPCRFTGTEPAAGTLNPLRSMVELVVLEFRLTTTSTV